MDKLQCQSRSSEDLHNEQWEADIVVMLQWHDPRVSGLVPKERGGTHQSKGQRLKKNLDISNAGFNKWVIHVTAKHVCRQGDACNIANAHLAFPHIALHRTHNPGGMLVEDSIC